MAKSDQRSIRCFARNELPETILKGGNTSDRNSKDTKDSKIYKQTVAVASQFRPCGMEVGPCVSPGPIAHR